MASVRSCLVSSLFQATQTSDFFSVLTTSQYWVPVVTGMPGLLLVSTLQQAPKLGMPVTFHFSMTVPGFPVPSSLFRLRSTSVYVPARYPKAISILVTFRLLPGVKAAACHHSGPPLPGPSIVAPAQHQYKPSGYLWARLSKMVVRPALLPT